MAKAKLSKEAIRFIVKTYECENKTYTFSEIVDLVNEKFGVKVSWQSIQLSYHKNKDSFKEKQNVVSKLDLDNAKKPVLETEKKSDSKTKKEVKPVTFERKVTQKSSSGFNENAGENLTKDDLKDLL